MFENIGHFFKRMVKQDQKELGSKDAAKERLHLVLMQDRANVSADFLELMKQEIIDVIKKYIVVDEASIDVRLTNQSNDDGTNGAPALYANIPIVNIKNDMMAEKVKEFKGVDFNKEMGLSTPKEEEKPETPSVIELAPISNPSEKEEHAEEENVQPIEVLETKIVKDSKIEKHEDVKDKSVESQEEHQNQPKEDEVHEENTETEETDDDDDDDDDVTFDDLLKAAEEEDKIKRKDKKK